MCSYPEHDKLSLAASQTQAIGEFIDWLQGQGVQLMRYREDLADVRPTDPVCGARHRENRSDPCWPTSVSDTGSADYYDTHCLHWHGQDRDADDVTGRRSGPAGMLWPCSLPPTSWVSGTRRARSA